MDVDVSKFESHEEIWGFCKFNIERDSKVFFNRWVSNVTCFSRKGDILVLAAPSIEHCRLLEDRIGIIVLRYASGLNSEIKEVKFVVPEISDINDINFDTPQTHAISNNPDAPVSLSPINKSIYDLVVKPERIMPINIYSFRHIPYVGTSAWFVYLSLSQIKYFNKKRNSSITTTFRDIAHWSGLSEKTINRMFNDHKMDWCAHKLGVTGFNDGKQTKVHTRFEICNLVPLTSGDAADLELYLIDAGLKTDPKGVLESIIADPNGITFSSSPHFEDKQNFRYKANGDFITVHTVVKNIIDAPLSVDISNLCSKLHHKLTDGFISIPWYFFENSLPVLGPDRGAFVLMCRRMTYRNVQTGEKRDFFWSTFDDLSEKLGIPVNQIAKWFPSLIETRPKKGNCTESSKAELDRLDGYKNVLSNHVMRIDVMSEKKKRLWKFHVNSQESLNPEDEKSVNIISFLTSHVSKEELFNWIDGCFVQFSENDKIVVLSSSQIMDSCSVHIKTALDSCFVQFGPVIDSCFVQILNILKDFKDTVI